MAGVNAYATSLRHERGRDDKAAESGVPVFVPQLAKVKTNVMCQAKRSQHLLFSFEKEDSAGPTSPGNMPYRKQGDQELYTDENLRKRRQLLRDKQVLAAISRFWETFPVVRQGAAQIDQADYLDVFVKLYKALVTPSEFSVAEARRIVEKDWNKDVGVEATTMTKDIFDRALFEVADIWTIGIGKDEYSSFLTKLFKRVTMTIYDSEKSRWVTVFQELDRIRSFATNDPGDDPALAHTVAEVMAAAPKPPRPPLVKRKSQKGETPSTPAKDTDAGAIESPEATLQTETRQARRRQDSIPPLALSSDSKPAASPNLRLQVSAAISASKGQSHDELHDYNNEDGSSSRTGTPDMPLTTRSEAPFRSMVAYQSGPRALDRGDSFQTDDDDSDGDGDQEVDGNNDAPMETSRQNARHRIQRSASTLSEASGLSKSRGSTSTSTKKAAPTSPVRPMLPELPTQHIRLAMPSIYLSPDLSQSQATERAARRRIRKSSKLAQRLRRITF